MDVVARLVDSDPALRWQVLADLTDAPADEVGAERAEVATTGWAAEFLAAQTEDGRWDGGTYRRDGSGCSPMSTGGRRP